jgi:hypothetical protein
MTIPEYKIIKIKRRQFVLGIFTTVFAHFLKPEAIKSFRIAINFLKIKCITQSVEQNRREKHVLDQGVSGALVRRPCFWQE